MKLTNVKHVHVAMTSCTQS